MTLEYENEELSEGGWPPPRFDRPCEPVSHERYQFFGDVAYAVIDGYRPLLLDLCVPRASTPCGCVVYVHGGGFRFGDRRSLPPTLTPGAIRDAVVSAGLAYATVDYRFCREASFPAQLHDVKSAIRYLRRFAGTFGLDAARFGIWGESAGGHLAALVGLTAMNRDLEGDVGVRGETSEVAAVVDWYGIAELLSMAASISLADDGKRDETLDLLLGMRVNENLEAAAMASPVHHVTSTSPPFLLVHGNDDHVVPVRQSEMLARSLEAEGVDVEFVRIPNADHCFVGFDDVAEIVASSVSYLAPYLQRARN
jgi:acetyl esterase/lipase